MVSGHLYNELGAEAPERVNLMMGRLLKGSTVSHFDNFHTLLQLSMN